MGTVTGFRSTPGEGYTTERVEVRPGVLIKMSPADKKAWQAAQPEAPERDPEPVERATVEAPETATAPAQRTRRPRARKA